MRDLDLQSVDHAVCALVDLFGDDPHESFLSLCSLTHACYAAARRWEPTSQAIRRVAPAIEAALEAQPADIAAPPELERLGELLLMYQALGGKA